MLRVINSPSTQTQEWDTAEPLAWPSCQPVRRVRKSWGCWGKPLTGDSSLPLGDLSPQASTTSSPGMIFTTRPIWVVDHSGMHHIVSFWHCWVIYSTEGEHMNSHPFAIAIIKFYSFDIAGYFQVGGILSQHRFLFKHFCFFSCKIFFKTFSQGA